MARFGRLIGSTWHDCLDAASIADAERRFAPALVAQWNAANQGFQSCPSNAQHGATDNGNGTATNPTSPSLAKPRVLDGADWREYAYAALGAGNPAAGLARYGQILKDGRASTNAATIAAFDQYDDATNFRKDRVALFLQVLVADGGIVTAEEYAAILAGWPEA